VSVQTPNQLKPWQRPMRLLTPGQRLATARARAVEEMPYFKAGVYELVPREMPGLGTLAVTDQGFLLYDPEAMANWTPEEAGNVILHEYMHIWLKHRERYEKLVKLGILTRSPEDMYLSNKCADAEINDNFEEAKKPLPHGPRGEEPIYPRNQGWKNHRTYEEYVFEALAARQKLSPSSKSKGSDPGGQDQGEDDQPSHGHDHGPAAGCGHCGSAGTNPVPNEPGMDAEGARTPADLEVNRKQVAEAIIRHQQKYGKGSVPTGISLMADKELREPTVSWLEHLERATQNAVSVKAGRLDYTRMRRSRRQQAVSGLDPEPIMASMIAPTIEVAFIADTSGSMLDELERILSEAYGLLQAMGGAKISFIACDAKVHSAIRTSSIEELMAAFKGGGGTDFRPAFEAVEQLQPYPDLIIFATDGDGDYPKEPPKADVIWLLVGGGEIKVDWGEVIEVNDLEEM